MSNNKINMSIRFAKEMKIIKDVLDVIPSQSRETQFQTIKYLFKEICKMDEFISLNPGFRNQIFKKMCEFRIYSELETSIKNLHFFLEKIKYRDDYVLDTLNGEYKRPTKILIEI
jgi:hypothetical protein